MCTIMIINLKHWQAIFQNQENYEQAPSAAMGSCYRLVLSKQKVFKYSGNIPFTCTAIEVC